MIKKFWSSIALVVVTIAFVLSTHVVLAVGNGNETVFNGSGTIVDTGTAVQLTSSIGLIWCLNIIADRDNQQPLYIGDIDVAGGIDGDGYKLWPGASIHMHSFIFTEVYINGTAGDKVYWVIGGVTWW